MGFIPGFIAFLFGSLSFIQRFWTQNHKLRKSIGFLFTRGRILYNNAGEKIMAIKAQCNDAIKCKEFKMLSMVVAKEDGLVEFMDYRGNKWIQIN
jgi:hypothetical protein